MIEELPGYIYFIAVSFVVSLINWMYNPKVETYQKVFSVYLLITLFVEGYAIFLFTRSISNLVLYNFFGILEFTFYFYLLYNLIASPGFKKMIRIIGLIYPFFCFCNAFFFQKSDFNSVTYAVGALLVALISMLYFYELFNSKHSVVLLEEPAFWLSTTLLFFYCCTFPYFALYNFISQLSVKAVTTLQTLLNLMNCLLYSLFTIAFLCRIRVRKFI